ncbi:DUF222 domain-containing protein [Mycolicibacterium sp. 050158]|uniref:DUF222 domain-containing protein n=1 Tax=Mycolicibacterium sp. 050158 TaxID=3090602 RepID=UPI00299EC58C|nr:DUF222 domain-containing protein [Mycolicibacterium sp. 050158]MDX1889421.1 DUF222 domain-containing protein [Mycolicibacterium sp. 050158]
MFEDVVASAHGARGGEAIAAWARVEAAACARRLAAMVTLLDIAHAASGSADREQWCIDNWGAVCAQIGATQHLTCGAASHLLLIGLALRERFPHLGAAFEDGRVDYRLVRTIVGRAALVVDPDTLRELDTAVAAAARTWPAMSAQKTVHAIDAIIASLDPAAVRRTHSRARGRAVEVVAQAGSGMAEIYASLFAVDAAALDTRLNGLADTVCEADPRTREQRRADALGALGHGTDRLACLCYTPDCPAAALPPARGVVIHVVAHHDTLTATTGHDGGPNGGDGEPDAGGNGDAGGPDDGPGQGTHDSPTVDDSDVGGTADDGDDRGSASDGHTTNSDSAVRESDAAPTESEPASPWTPTPDEYLGIDGPPPPQFTKPLRELTLTELMTPLPGRRAHLAPGMLIGGGVLPGAITRRAAHHAQLRPVLHPGQAPPEPRYTPTTALADYVRCRDLTCRFPGCTTPAITCDLEPRHPLAPRPHLRSQPHRPMPPTPPTEDLLGRRPRLAAPPAARRHRTLDRPRRPHPHDHPRQPTTVPHPQHTRCTPRHLHHHATTGPHRRPDHAPPPHHPRPRPHQPHPPRTPTQPARAPSQTLASELQHSRRSAGA